MASLPALLLFCSFAVVQCSAEVEVSEDIENHKGIRFDEPESRRCYTCRRVGDNEECNHEISQCGKGEFCRTVVNSKHNGAIKVTKTCKKSCRTPNQTFCNEAGIKCWYCCDSDLCNKGLNYNEDNNVTTKCPAERGPPGPSGPPGLPGREGMKGNSGLPGRDGLPGLPGIKGRKGDGGTSGLPGLIGQKGEPGLPGLDGPPGLPASKAGQKGEMGSPGMDGFPGAPGLPGLPGMKGDQGLNGSPGDCTCPQPPPEVPKPEAVVFYGRVSGVSQMRTIPVNVMIDTSVNLGHAYNTTTSVFTAPYRAVYLFSVHVICDGNKAVPLLLYKNEESVASSGRREENQIGTGAFYPVGIIQVILTLEVGDEVTLRITPKGEGFWDRFKSFMASHSDVTYSGHMIGYA